MHRLAMLAACVMMGEVWYEIWMCSSCQQILVSTYFHTHPYTRAVTSCLGMFIRTYGQNGVVLETSY